MNEQMMKSLVDLIDESLAEIEELKKSDRFSPSEIKIEGPGSGISGKPVNGSLDKDEDEEDEEDEDEDEDEDEAKKAEGHNRSSDPNGGSHKIVKADTGMPKGTVAKSDIEKAQDAMDKAEAAMAAAKADMEKAEGRNRSSDPNGGSHKVAKADDDDDDDDDDKDAKDAKANKFLKKTAEESNTLLKSYVDQRLAPIEGQLEAIMALVKQVADAPAPAKGASYRNVAPLRKSDDSESTLTKSSLVDRLLDLKKSGSRVDSVDVASAELGGPNELAKIAHKYNIK